MIETPNPGLLELLEWQVARGLDRPLLVADGRPWSAADLATRSARMASALHAHGVRAGDRVALWLPNGEPWVTCLLACARLRAAVVAVNTRFRAGEVGDLLQRTRARVLVLPPQFEDVLSQLETEQCRALRALVLVGDAGPGRREEMPRLQFEAAVSAGDGWRETVPDRGEPCILFTTSGTTRRPKLVQHGGAVLARHAGHVVDRIGLDLPGAKLFLPIPLGGVFGFVQLVACLSCGAPLHLAASFDPQAALAAVREQSITHLIGPDTVFSALLELDPAGLSLRSLRFCAYGAFNPALADLPQRARSAGLVLHGLYGSSELLALFAVGPRTGADAVISAAGGVPACPQVVVRACLEGELLPHGQPGELEISTPHRMLGYFEDPQATQSAYTADGFFRTGDLGSTHDDGRFSYEARIGDVLRLAGYLVAPAEIEHVIAQYPGVAACQVVGVLLEGKLRVAAFVVLQGPEPAVTAPAIQAHCSARLARYKVPALVAFIPAMPTTASANGVKVQKHVLRAWAEQMAMGHPAPWNQDA